MSEADPPPPMRRLGDSTIASLLAGTAKPGAWRLILQQRELPLNLAASESFWVGSSDVAGLQLTHHSVRAEHCAFTRRGDGLVLRAAPGAPVKVNGTPVSAPTLLTGGERIRVGEIELRVERGGVAATVVRRELEFSSSQEFYRLMRRELAHAPWLLLSLGLHALLFLILFDPDADKKPLGRSVTLTSQIASADDVAVPPTEPPSPVDHQPEVVETETDLPEIDPTNDPFEVDDLPELEAPMSGVDMPTSAGLGSAFGESQKGGLGRGPGIKLNRMEKGLRHTIEGYREGGLDLAVLIDTTSSMGPLIESTKRTIDQIITDFGALVPNLKIAVVAFRDHGDGEAYLTRTQDLSDDRYRILNFLDGLDAGGGGDTPEAVYDAIRVAFEELEWRQDSYRAVLVVGDAPPHREDVSKLNQLLRDRTAGKRGKTFVSTICVASEKSGFGAEEIERVVSTFTEIAKHGRGEFTHLEDVQAVGDELIATVIGRNHRDAIVAALRDTRHDFKDLILAEKVKKRDTAWLVHQFGRGKCDPVLIDALVRLQSHTVAQRCFAIVRNDAAPRPQREAAVYVLRRTTGYRGDLDLERPFSTQTLEVDRLQDSIRRTFGSLDSPDKKPPRRVR